MVWQPWQPPAGHVGVQPPASSPQGDNHAAQNTNPTPSQSQPKATGVSDPQALRWAGPSGKQAAARAPAGEDSSLSGLPNDAQRSSRPAAFPLKRVDFASNYDPFFSLSPVHHAQFEDAGAAGYDFGGPPGGTCSPYPGSCAACEGNCDGYDCGGAYCFQPYWSPFQNRLELRSEYLLWWGKGDHVPALLTTSPQGSGGVLGAAGTTVLFGDADLNDEARSGGRFTLDYWLCPDHCTAIEASYLCLAHHTEAFSRTSQGDPLLARPFYNVQDGAQEASLIAATGLWTGSVSMSETTNFQGAEVLFRHNWFRQCGSRLDFLFGYRYLQLDDDLRMDDTKTSTDPEGELPVGTILAQSDRFQTLNQFNGVELGMLGQWQYCCWSVDLLMKLGLGDTNSRVRINGSTTITEPDVAAATYPGGFLALPTNFTNSAHNQFAMVPELGATIGYDLTCRLRFTAGYSLIYWSKVARPGDQIDTTLNTSQLPPGTLTGAALPQFRYTTTDYWAQGLNLGLDFRF